MHFEKLNYSFANETTEIELALMPENVESVFCIAGSGSRLTPLLSKNPIRMDVYDSSLNQLYISELRYQSIKQLDYESYLNLLGYTETTKADRISIFHRLILKSEIKIFWLHTNTEWQSKGFIFIGSWEKKLKLLNSIFRFFHFKNMNQVFEKNDAQLFPARAWNIFCKCILTKTVVSRLLYSGQSKYNLPLPFGKYISEQFLKQIKKNDLAHEFFMQFLFCGRLLSSAAWPLEARADIFKGVKLSQTQVRFVQKNLSDINTLDYNFYSLSDCFSYLSEADSQNVIDKICQSRIKSSGVFRYFMFRPGLELKKFSKIVEISSDFDKVPIYKIWSFSTEK